MQINKLISKINVFNDSVFSLEIGTNDSEILK